MDWLTMEHTDKSLDRIKQRLHIIGNHHQFDGFVSGARQSQEFKSENFDGLFRIASDLLERLCVIAKKGGMENSDRMHGEAFAAGISGKCPDCEIVAELDFLKSLRKVE